MASEKVPTSSVDQLPHTSGTASTSTQLLTASCHCGHVTLELPSPPTELNECRCTACYKYGALWAYYPRGDVMVTVAATDKDVSLKEYVRSDKDSKASIGFYSCGHCGCMTHWWGLGEQEGDEKSMGVNGRMLPENAIEGVKRKISRR